MSHPAAQNVRADLTPGRVIVQKYRVERVLGRGGMGVVVEARHLALDERVAMKFLHPEVSCVPDAVARFLREARVVIKIKSEHVVRVMDVATLETGEPFMVMECLDGLDLLQKVKRDGPMSIHDAIDCVVQACDALAEAHQLGIVHRDIKPSNLFLTRGTDGAAVVKLLDFGISKVASAEGLNPLTRTSMTMGSAQYMSPEQMRSMRDVDLRTDVYSLGATLYKLLAGRAPFDGESMPAVFAKILEGAAPPLSSLRPDVPEALSRAIEKAYAREPSARYGSVTELVFALSPHAGSASRATIERIARFAAHPGQQPVVVPAAQPSSPGPWSQRPSQPQASTQLLPETGAASAAADDAPTRPMPPRQATAPIELPVRRGGGALVIGVVVAAALVGGAALWWRAKNASTESAAEMPPAASAPAAEVGSPTSEPAAAAPSTTAASSMTPVATASAAETPPALDAGVATAPVSTFPRPAFPFPPRPTAAASAPAPAAPPAPTTPKPSAFDTR